MDRSDAIARLMHEFGYSATAATVVAERLARASPSVQAAFLAWRATEKPPDLCVTGYSVERLMREHGMQPVAALLTLDWLTRDPARAKASLRKGHDRVVSRPHRLKHQGDTLGAIGGPATLDE